MGHIKLSFSGNGPVNQSHHFRSTKNLREIDPRRARFHCYHSLGSIEQEANKDGAHKEVTKACKRMGQGESVTVANVNDDSCRLPLKMWAMKHAG